ncbi:MAG: hypothetical protein ACLFNL_07810 [Bacteroidales bacterium]
MSTHDENIDKRTRELFQKTGFEKPSGNFTSEVMKKVRKERIYGKSTYENLWQILLAAGLPLLYFLYRYLTGKINFIDELITGIKASNYFKFADLIADTFIYDISMSPAVLIGIISIVLLLVFDKIILKFIYSSQ